MKNKITDLVVEKIKRCNEMCFCSDPSYNKEGLLTDQRRCGNCHSKDILVEMLCEINDLEREEIK